MERENQRIKITKRMFNEALLRLLQKKQLSKISVSELCTEAGLNRTTFYRHYNIPQDILTELREEIVKNANTAPFLPRTQSELRELILKLCNYVNFNKEIIRIIIRNDTSSALTELFEKHIYEILKSVKISQNNTELDDESVILIASYCAGGGFQLLKRWLTDNVKKTPEEIAETIIILINKNITWHI